MYNRQIIWKIKLNSVVCYNVLVHPFRYFFPTYENDSLLCALVDNDDGDDDGTANGAGEEVIAEDLPEGVRECRIEHSGKIQDAGDFLDNY